MGKWEVTVLWVQFLFEMTDKVTEMDGGDGHATR